MDKINTIKFYQNLGKLYYAIAASDKVVREEELDKLNETVKKVWLTSNSVQNDVKAEAEHSIINTFKWLNKDNEYDAETCFNSFIKYKKENDQLFTEELKLLILKTANVIASSFSGINKSELIMLAKLNLELKKT
jgi:hypothetical protein